MSVKGIKMITFPKLSFMQSKTLLYDYEQSFQSYFCIILYVGYNILCMEINNSRHNIPSSSREINSPHDVLQEQLFVY